MSIGWGVLGSYVPDAPHHVRPGSLSTPGKWKCGKLTQHERCDERDLLAKKTPFETTAARPPQGERVWRLLRANGGRKEAFFGERSLEDDPALLKAMLAKHFCAAQEAKLNAARANRQAEQYRELHEVSSDWARSCKPS